ncbi:hypothetical protein GH714_027353 [Hevea brasiliensis]|uniref:Wall-associated receptor kinase galacturonan-binding domain-containing protein n=1 Tax=Hevea brasiliensis TaxID=3981 RepID=A0A6A6LMV8_HEVBR|nr:hypothetical protein GH714_027353 [Hevea brasiliensis]
MSVKLVSQVSLSLALLLTIQLAIAKGPIAKPGCTDHCGNIDIPYPFGMGEKDCYFNEWFEIECKESRAFISKIKMELLNISVEGWANVKSPIISSDCSDRESDLPFNLAGSPFFISDDNVFIAVGCNTRALMIDVSLQRLGCESTCLGHKKDVDWRQMLPNFIGGVPVVFDPKFQALSNQSTDGCKLAFLAGTYRANSWRKKDPNVQFPMVLDWMLYSNRTESYNWMINSGLWSGNYSESESLACISDGGIIGVLVIVFGIQMLCKLMKKRRNIQLKKKFFERNGGLLLQQQLTSSDGSVKKTQIFTSKELEKATDRFNDNRILGQGGQGRVYKGMLADGRIVASKCPN